MSFAGNKGITWLHSHHQHLRLQQSHDGVLTETAHKYKKSKSQKKSRKATASFTNSVSCLCPQENVRTLSPSLRRHQFSTLQASQDGPELSDCRQEAQRSREDLKFVVEAVAPPLLSSLGGGEEHRKTLEDRSNRFPLSFTNGYSKPY